MNEFLELFDYNAWAHRTIFDAVARLPEEQYFRDLKSSYGGVHGTLCHIVWAEQLWLHRWKKLPNPTVPQGADLKSLQDARGRWETVERERADHLSHLSDAQLDDTRVVKPSTGGEYVHTFRQMFRHVINHSSYHRGQIVTFMRQLGTSPPSTDLILYYRRKASQLG